MGIPPLRPAGPPSSQGSDGPKRGKSQKDFSLKKKEEREEKKKGPMDLAQEEKQKEIETQYKGEEIQASEKAGSIQAQAAKVSDIGKLIQQMVTDLKVGTVGGKDFASMTLSEKTAKVPEAFAGSQLTLAYKETGLSISFTNFATPQQQQLAINMVEQNKQQLAEMVQTLQAKNVNITDFSVGGRQITLPRAEPLPPPFQAQEAQPETGRDKDREQGEEKGGQGGPS